MAEDTEEKKRDLDEEFKKFLENQGKSEDWYNGLEVSSDEYKELLKAFDERKKEAPEEEKKSEDKEELTPEERKAAREEQVPTDEFKEFIEKTYGEGSFEKHYEKGPDEEKDRFEIQYEAVTKKSPLREAKTTIIDENIKETDGKENTDDVHKDEPEWKKMRRKAWEKYADDNKQEFKLLSDDEAPDLKMQVGKTPIQYADENHVSMGNDEYAKFLQAIEIEVKAGTDVINFGDIKSEDYKSKLAAACLAKGLKMKNGPEMIDLTLECFKDLDEDTKAKIAVYNAEKAAAKEKEKSKDEKKESKEENKEEKKEEKEIDTKGKTKEEYAAMYEGKLKEFEGKESLDFSQIKDPVERVIAYTAAKKSGLKIENLNNNDLLFDEKNNADRTEDVSKALTAMPVEDRGHFNIHEKRVAELQKVKQLIKDKKLKYGQYRDQDGNVHNSQLSTTVKDTDGKAVVNDKGKATRSERVDRNKVEYTYDEETKKKTYNKDENGLYQLRQRQNGGR